MAISGKTTKLEWPYALSTDKPPDGPALSKAQAERAEAIFVGTAGQILISQSSGVPKPKTVKGDGTFSEDGTLTVAAGAISSNKLKPTCGIKQGTGSLITLTSSYQDIGGTTLEITPVVASYLRVVAVFGMNAHSNNSPETTQALGTLSLDGTDQTAPLASLSTLTPTVNIVIAGTVSAVYLLPLTAAKHTVKMRAKKNSGVEAPTVDPTLSYFSYDLVAQ